MAVKTATDKINVLTRTLYMFVGLNKGECPIDGLWVHWLYLAYLIKCVKINLYNLGPKQVHLSANTLPRGQK